MSENATTSITPYEQLKQDSRSLRGTLAEERLSAEPSFSKDGQSLIKFHGLYQQKERGPEAKGRPPVLMVRGRIAGGRLDADQYLAWDRLADAYGDGTLRITTRQDLELHGVLKGDLRAALAGLARALQSTKGACGDVVRAVTQAPNPWGRTDLAQLDAVVDQLAARFRIGSRAYEEIWLDGEPVAGEAEPVYGDSYLPRKFKIAVTAAGENLVDLFSNDLAFAATFDVVGTLDGFLVFAGGGMGMTHGDSSTFPRLADFLGWVAPADLLPVAEAVVAVHRDFGDRADRRHARLKYLLHRRGLDWFQVEVERRWGGRFRAASVPAWNSRPLTGWMDRVDGTRALGLGLACGRIQGPAKAALREVVARFRPRILLSPDQDLILVGLPAAADAEIESLLRGGGIDLAPSPLSARALACVALPLCGLALTEAERALPATLDLLRDALQRQGIAERSLLFRMTGCGNGCARPYTAELALVGRTARAFAVYVGGSPEGNRLAFELIPMQPPALLPELLDGLFGAWRGEGLPEEGFGDFTARLGAPALLHRLEVRHA